MDGKEVCLLEVWLLVVCIGGDCGCVFGNVGDVFVEMWVLVWCWLDFVFNGVCDDVCDFGDEGWRDFVLNGGEGWFEFVECSWVFFLEVGVNLFLFVFGDVLCVFVSL